MHVLQVLTLTHLNQFLRETSYIISISPGSVIIEHMIIQCYVWLYISPIDGTSRYLSLIQSELYLFSEIQCAVKCFIAIGVNGTALCPCIVANEF